MPFVIVLTRPGNIHDKNHNTTSALLYYNSHHGRDDSYQTILHLIINTSDLCYHDQKVSMVKRSGMSFGRDDSDQTISDHIMNPTSVLYVPYLTRKLCGSLQFLQSFVSLTASMLYQIMVIKMMAILLSGFKSVSASVLSFQN